MPPLLIPFLAQFALAGGAYFAAPRLARGSKSLRLTALAVALGAMFLWPLMRVFPVQPIEWLGAPVVACIELTGLAIPAVLFFGIASRCVPKPGDGKAIRLLVVFAAIYFVRAGWWMVAPVSTPAAVIGPTRIDGQGVCRQTTGYTCVAASMVTMLRARGIPADEAEMARLAHTQTGGGATDSRAVWALQRKLAGGPLRPRYARLDAAELAAAPKPCLVQLDWGFFVSHMVPVLEATPQRVVIGDPLSGRREMSMPDFLTRWKRTAIVLETRR